MNSRCNGINVHKENGQEYKVYQCRNCFEAYEQLEKAEQCCDTEMTFIDETIPPDLKEKKKVIL